ncbi:MAG TPA: recombination regulator RecX [Burkholderiales bacterium]|nr:recombination regulator RecX [Burkholderiales bacterium]
MKKLSLRARAIDLLARREHSRSELARKLARHAEEGDDIDALLDDLVARKLLSDERYAEARAHTLSRKYGAARIAHDLRMQGVDEEIVRRIADEARRTEVQRAREAWQKRFGRLPESAEERARQMRFLAARGFSGEAVRQVLRTLGDD